MALDLGSHLCCGWAISLFLIALFHTSIRVALFPFRQVKVWFQNRRMKHKRQTLSKTDDEDNKDSLKGDDDQSDSSKWSDPWPLIMPALENQSWSSTNSKIIEKCSYSYSYFAANRFIKVAWISRCLWDLGHFRAVAQLKEITNYVASWRKGGKERRSRGTNNAPTFTFWGFYAEE